MRSPRRQKLLRDLRLNRGRAAMMVVGVAVSLFGVGTMLSAYTILTREISRSYLGTSPASATLEMDVVDEELVEAVQERPGIAAAVARATVKGRVKVGSTWFFLTLFVVDDFEDMRVAKVRPEAGAWPPPRGGLLLERAAFVGLEKEIGDTLVVKTPHGAPREVQVAGRVHDPSLAPAWQERTVYGYITPETLAWLGEPAALDELKIVVAENREDAAAIDAVAQDLSMWLKAQGRAVREIQIPPPARHPHQSQMTAILFMMLLFSVMALVLSALLVATVIAALLTRQVREIGVMKAIGARSGQIAGLYVALLLVLGIAALLLALPPSIFAGRAFAAVVAGLLNFDVESNAVPAWVFAVQAAAGLVVPLLAASAPIARASRITVRQALDEHGVTETFGQRRLDAVLSAVRGLDRVLLLTLRNTFRRRGRLLLTLGLLSAGGAMFLTGVGTSKAWNALVDEVYATRSYDAELRLNQAEPIDVVLSALRGLPQVRDVEPWGLAPATLSRPGKIDVVATYPDGGHGSFSVLAPPATTRLVDFEVLSGRWLAPEDDANDGGADEAAVLNHMALSLIPGVTVGDRITISVAGRPTPLRVVGVVREVGSAAVAYLTDVSFARVTGVEDRARMFRLVTTASDREQRAAALTAIEAALDEAQVGVASVMPLSELRTAMGEHVFVLVASLLAMATLMAIVGLLGLTSTMSMNVIERTREVGVMQAVGATPRTVLRVIVGEGVFVGALSWLVAVALAVPLSAIVGEVVGGLAFKVPLPLVVSPLALALWWLLVVVAAAVASALPAWRASRLTAREALAYV